jgi:rod shape-determining protein MreC
MLFSKNTFLGLRATVLIVLAIFVMMADRHLAYFADIKSVFISLIAPFQRLVNWPITFIDFAMANISSKDELLAENAKLRAQQLLLQAEVQKLVALEHENAKLRGLITAVTPTKDKFVIAQLLAVDTNSFNQQVILDKGKHKDVYIGQPVLDAYGLVGQVILAGLNTSVVLLVTDTKSAIPVQDSRNGTRAIAVGSGDKSNLELIQVSETMDIKEGDLLTTSDLGSHFPAGYPVGQVKKIQHISGERFLKIMVTPSAHINQSRQVLLIWPQKNRKMEHKA